MAGRPKHRAKPNPSTWAVWCARPAPAQRALQLERIDAPWKFGESGDSFRTVEEQEELRAMVAADDAARRRRNLHAGTSVGNGWFGFVEYSPGRFLEYRKKTSSRKGFRVKPSRVPGATHLDYGAALATQAARFAPTAVGDGERLPFPSESFELVTMECVFSALPDKPALASSRQTARPRVSASIRRISSKSTPTTHAAATT